MASRANAGRSVHGAPAGVVVATPVARQGTPTSSTLFPRPGICLCARYGSRRPVPRARRSQALSTWRPACDMMACAGGGGTAGIAGVAGAGEMLAGDGARVALPGGWLDLGRHQSGTRGGGQAPEPWRAAWQVPPIQRIVRQLPPFICCLGSALRPCGVCDVAGLRGWCVGVWSVRCCKINSDTEGCSCRFRLLRRRSVMLSCASPEASLLHDLLRDAMYIDVRTRRAP